MRKVSILTLLLILFSLVGCDFFEDEVVSYDDCTNVELAVIWNGLAGIYPSKGTDNPVAQEIRNKTKINA